MEPSSTTTPTPLTGPVAARPEQRWLSWPVWLVSVLAGVAAAVTTELYGQLARAVGIPMRAGNLGADTAGPIGVGTFTMGVATAMFWGTILAVLIARYARRPARTYALTTVVLTLVSLAAPFNAGAASLSTKTMLAIAHLIAAAIVIPVVTRRLTRVPGRQPRA